MNLPSCCTDDMKKKVASGMNAGSAMMHALKAHKAGKHDDDNDDDYSGAGDDDYKGDK